MFYFYENRNWDWFGDYSTFRPVKWEFMPIWNGNKWNLKVSKALIGTANNKEKIYIIECDYILNMGNGYCVCKVGKKIKVIMADVEDEGFIEFAFEADDVKPIFSNDSDGDSLPLCSFDVYLNGKVEHIDISIVRENSIKYGYKKFGNSPKIYNGLF